MRSRHLCWLQPPQLASSASSVASHNYYDADVADMTSVTGQPTGCNWNRFLNIRISRSLSLSLARVSGSLQPWRLLISVAETLMTAVRLRLARMTTPWLVVVSTITTDESSYDSCWSSSHDRNHRSGVVVDERYIDVEITLASHLRWNEKDSNEYTYSMLRPHSLHHCNISSIPKLIEKHS